MGYCSFQDSSQNYTHSSLLSSPHHIYEEYIETPSVCFKPWIVSNPIKCFISYRYIPMIKFILKNRPLKIGTVRVIKVIRMCCLSKYLVLSLLVMMWDDTTPLWWDEVRWMMQALWPSVRQLGTFWLSIRRRIICFWTSGDRNHRWETTELYHLITLRQA